MKIKMRLLLAGLAIIFIAALQAHATTFTVSIQPIQICNDSGANCANPTRQLFESAGDKIWAQAGIDLSFLPWHTLNETDYLSLSVDSGFDFEDLHDDALANGGSSNPLVLDMWFADDLDANAGFFGVTSSLGGRYIAIGWDAVASFNGGLGRLDTMAHEIGHSLGLDHFTFGAGGADNLMTQGSDRSTPGSLANINPDGLDLDKLNTQQITTADGSRYAIRDSQNVVPEPGTLTLVGLGISRTDVKDEEGIEKPKIENYKKAATNNL
jgi:hypothetical protein